MIYLEDIPAADPRFDFPLIASALLPILHQGTGSSVVVGIHGPWGSGKTTLMEEVRRQAVAIEGDRAIIVPFNAWKFQDREALWRALILQMLGAVRAALPANPDPAKLKQIEELERSLYQAFVVHDKGPWRVNLRSVAVEVLTIGLQLARLDMFSGPVQGVFGWLAGPFGGSNKDSNRRLDPPEIEKLGSILERTTVDRQVQQVRSIEQFLGKFSALVDDLVQAGRRIYVFIDDLDRCLPDAALEIFEAIKLFLDAPGCAYTVAVDREVIRRGLLLKYGRQTAALDSPDLIDPDEYIEKTISLSFDLPRLSVLDVQTFMRDCPLTADIAQAELDLITVGVGVNPRRVKRFVNSLAVHLEIARLSQNDGVPIYQWASDQADRTNFRLFLKFLLLGYRSSGLIALALQDPLLLGRLQGVALTYFNTVRAGQLADARQERVNSLKNEPALVRESVDNEPLWKLIAAGPNMATHEDIMRQLANWFRDRPAATAVRNGADAAHQAVLTST